VASYVASYVAGLGGATGTMEYKVSANAVEISFKNLNFEDEGLRNLIHTELFVLIIVVELRSRNTSHYLLDPPGSWGNHVRDAPNRCTGGGWKSRQVSLRGVDL